MQYHEKVVLMALTGGVACLRPDTNWRKYGKKIKETLVFFKMN